MPSCIASWVGLNVEGHSQQLYTGSQYSVYNKIPLTLIVPHVNSINVRAAYVSVPVI